MPQWSDISIHALREEGDSLILGRCAWLWYFYPRPPRGGRPFFPCIRVSPRIFLSTPSARRATFKSTLCPGPYLISIHALREEGDSIMVYLQSNSRKFLSTPSARRATQGQCAGWFSSHRFLSTPSARRATSGSGPGSRKRSDFYPRPPRGGRQKGVLTRSVFTLFLSTPSARRATRPRK